MPSEKELRWSQLKVGILTVASLTVLTILIFLMSGSTGGLFTRKLNLVAHFENANGLKVGAPVTLDGVTIGNVVSVRIVPHHEPSSVEVVSRVSANYLPSLHVDSTAAIDQAGVLGDSFLEISSTRAVGPQPADNAELKVDSKPGIQDVIGNSQQSIESINGVVKKLGVLVDKINEGQGTVGVLLNDKALANKIVHTVDGLQTMMSQISNGKGTLGKLITDDAMYDRANSTIEKLNEIVMRLDKGEGSAGKLLKDDSLYRNLNSAVENTNQLLAGINAGKGSLGKLAKDPALAEKLEESIGRLNGIMKGLQDGQGSLGQLVVNRSLYDNLDQTINQTGQLVTAIRKDPKTYLTVRVKVF